MYNPKLQIQLEVPNLTKLENIKSFINSKILNDDKLKLLTESNITITGISKLNKLNYFLNSDYLLLSSVKTEQVYDSIKNNIPIGINGKISFHLCPTGEINDWQGCKDDPRSQYKEFVF